jgi:carboxylate-amine ligase
VAEEFLLIDPRTGRNAPVADQVVAGLAPELREWSRLEFRRGMVETVTPVCSDLLEVHRTLTRLRHAVADGAADAGARLVAVGTTPVADRQRAMPDTPRYHAMVRQFGPIAGGPACCGCRVHVGVPDRELAVQVCNHLRVWLPVIQALTVNSPLYEGTDTSHASWRSMQLACWPNLGPTPYFDSADEYDRTVDLLIASDVMLDRAMVYWYARPSVTHSAVEVRAADVCPTVDDTVLIAGLIRALVATAIEDIRGGLSAPQVRDCLVSAAHWHAAHDGLDGTLIDLRLGSARPAWDLVDELFATVSPALLRHGDLHLALAELARVRWRGTGAARQRRIYRRTHDIHAVLADLAEQTVGR